MKFQIIKNTLTRAAGRSGLLLKKYSPEILIGTGIVGTVVSGVMACRATLKVGEVQTKAQQALEKIKLAKEGVDSLKDRAKAKALYTEKDYKKDLTMVHVQKALDYVKLYGPAVTLGVASIASILAGQGIMKKRNLAVVAAFKAVEQSFSDYRKRVVEEYGEDKDRQLKYGINKVKVTDMAYTDEEGTEHPTKEYEVEVIDPSGISQYARFFDESCSNWSKIPEYNLSFLKGQQNFANDLLRARGHLFLNEVYDGLGLPRTQAGAVVGWVKGAGDNFVDFGIFNADSEKARDFVNGYERSILLDFNVAGIIYDMI